EVLVENLKDKVYLRTYQEIDSVLDPNPRLMMALDIRHFCLSRVDPIEGFKRYHERVKSVHFRADCGLDARALRRFLEQLLDYNYSGLFIIEDRALNIMAKNDKSQLLEGREQIFGILDELAGRLTRREEREAGG